MATANIKAVITAEDRTGAALTGFKKNIESANNEVSRMQDRMATVGKVGLVALAVGLGAAATQAFEQVRAVENASFALKAYEKDAGKVSKVLSGLVAFARSDMGVLFQREDLFAAAQTLKLYGQSTETLTDKVKLLARGVSLGKTTFQELSSIVGRAAAKGRLDAVDFDMLIERGIGLDESFRGAAVTSEQLFAELERALPASLLEGRANTIDGAMIKLQSAFRDLGSTILGVDKETSQFIKGGLGDKFMESMGKLTEALKKPEVKKALTDLAEGIGKVIDFMAQHPDIVVGAAAVAVGIIGIATASNILKDAAVGARAAISLITAHPILAAATAVVATLIWAKGEIDKLAEQSKAEAQAQTDWLNQKEAEALANTNLTEEQRTQIKNSYSRLREANEKVHQDEMRKQQWLGLRGLLEDIYQWGYDTLHSLSVWSLQVMMKITTPFINAGLHIFNFFANLPSQAASAVSGIVAWFMTLPGRIASAIGGMGSIIKSSIGNISVGGKSLRDIIPGFASGVSNFGGGLAVVGERGPELVNLPRGSDVIPNNRMGMSSASNTTININVGLMTGSAIERRDAAAKMFEDLKDIASAKGQTVSQMIGAA